MISAAARSLTVCVFLCLAWLAVSSPAALAEGASSRAASSQSPLAGSLMVAAVQRLVDNQGASQAEAVRLSSPEAVLAREMSQTAHQHLNRAQAAQLAREAFPAVIDQPLGGPPSLPKGQRITGFAKANVAQVDLGGGRHGVVESLVPMAIATADKWAAVNLALRDSGSTFAPTNPLVGVDIPKRLADGVQLPSRGLSLTPANASGAPLAGSEGTLDGASVLYANTQINTDTVIKPTPLGLDAQTLLRAADSPEHLYYRVGLPAGARLTLNHTSGVVCIVKEGAILAIVAPPVAQDAAGSAVPVSMAVTGNVLALTVARLPGAYQYPIDVDPEFNSTPETFTTSNWHFGEVTSGNFAHYSGSSMLEMHHTGSFSATNWADWAMTTNGDSHIYQVSVADGVNPTSSNGNGEEWTPSYLDEYLELRKGGEESHAVTLSGRPPLKSATVCPVAGCSATSGLEGNAVIFEVTTLEPSTILEENGNQELIPYGGNLNSATIYIAQPKETHTTVTLNRSARELEVKPGERTPNVLAPSSGIEGWLGPRSAGAFEFETKDAGLGVADTAVEVDNSGTWTPEDQRYYITEGIACHGVQCAPAQHEVVTYQALAGYLFNGEDKIRAQGHDAMEHTSSAEHGEGEATLKIDTEPPHNLTVTGLPTKGETFELGELPATVKAEATDGEKEIPSSGIKSLALYIDGKEIGKPNGPCYPGPCTATGEWSINGAELGAGVHTLTVLATDNANNYTISKAFSLDVYHASPVALGPGSINPESGDFALEATDVALSGGTGSLAVTRHYDSRNPNEGVESPLGPQWTLSLGSLASLEVLPDGSVMVVGQNGLTHFSIKPGGGFEAPTGDTDLTLTAETNTKKEIVAYLLEDKMSGTSTKFTLPAGAKSWMPTLAKGPVATDTMTDTYTTIEIEAGEPLVEPRLEVAPHPQATCEAVEVEHKLEIKFEAGCRALELQYGTATEASGESESQWGEF